MCLLGKPHQVPRGWQQVCRKAALPPQSRDPCSLFLSPNGKIFKTMDEVASYSKVLDQRKMEKKQKAKAKLNGVVAGASKTEPGPLASWPASKTTAPVAEVAQVTPALGPKSPAKGAMVNVIPLPNKMFNPVPLPAMLPSDPGCPASKKIKLDDVPNALGNGTKLKCPECDNSFFNVSRLEKHFKNVHIAASQLPSSMESCLTCDTRLVVV